MIAIIRQWVTKSGVWYVTAERARDSEFNGFAFVDHQSKRWNEHGTMSFTHHVDAFIYVGF